MSELTEKNASYSEGLKFYLGLNAEPVAVKLVKEGEEFPSGAERPDEQYSHCQAMFYARKGRCLKLLPEDQKCHVGASALGMMPTPEKVIDGEFHHNIGIHDSKEAAASMIAQRVDIGCRTAGEVVCPLNKADFVPDVVVMADIPEKFYWIVCASTAEKGGHAAYTMAPFQCTCEDITVTPIVTGRPNMSMGCFGCRRRTDMKPEEMAMGIPYREIPGYLEHFARWQDGDKAPMNRAKRD